MEIRGPCHWTWASENSRRVATANEGAKICSVNNIRLVLKLVLGGALIVVSIRGIEPCHQLFCGFLQ